MRVKVMFMILALAFGGALVNAYLASVEIAATTMMIPLAYIALIILVVFFIGRSEKRVVEIKPHGGE